MDEKLVGLDLAHGAGQTTFMTFVEVVGDLDVEPDEVFQLEVFDVDGAIIEKGTAIGTILYDDQEPPRPLLTIGRFLASTG